MICCIKKIQIKNNSFLFSFMAFVCLFITNVSFIYSQPLNKLPETTDGNGWINQSLYIEKCGLDFTSGSVKLCQRCTPTGIVQPAPITISGIPATAVIEKALLYTDASGNGTPITATLTNPISATMNFLMDTIGKDVDKNWGYAGTYSYRADVTSIISGNGVYVLSGLPTSLTDTANDVDGASLIVIYRDTTVTTWKGAMSIDDGAFVMQYGAGFGFGGYYTMCSADSAKAFLIIADMQFTYNVNCNWCITNNNPPLSMNFPPNMWNYVQTPFNGVIAGGGSISGPLNFQNNEWVNVVAGGVYWRDTCCTGCYVPLAVTTDTSIVDCFGNNTGTATANTTGGVPPYTYNWFPSGQTTQTATGLAASVYTVTVTDASGCTTSLSDTAMVTSPTSLSAFSATISNATCFGYSDGVATVNVIGGTPPYTYLWSIIPAQTTQTVTGLAAGTYTINVVDANGCIINTLASVSQPQPVSATFYQMNLKCNGICNGYLSLIPAGGTPPYTYLWSTGETNVYIDSLCAGTYSVFITDTNGCTGSASTIITQPATPFVVTSTYTNPTCWNSNNGTASVSASGGITPYTYTWLPSGQTTTSISNLGTTAFTCYVLDSIGCATTLTFQITAPPFFTTAPIPGPKKICFGDSVALTANPSGGTPAYTYSWTPGLYSTQTIYPSPTTNTTYTVFVSDANGCNAFKRMVTVIVYPLPIVDAGINDSMCIGDSVALSASGGIIYSWNPSTLLSNANIPNPVSSATSTVSYTVTATDSLGCSNKDSVVIAVWSLPPITAFSDTTICVGGTAFLNATGGVSYSWYPPGGLSDSLIANPIATPSAPISYTVTGTDANGCRNNDSVTVSTHIMPLAGFSYSLELACEGMTARFSDSSINATSLFWDFGTSNTSVQQNPAILLPYQNSYSVTLVASLPPCSDTVIKILDVNDFADYILIQESNVFTPNGDGINDCFNMLTNGKFAGCADLTIYDRWGVSVFHSSYSGSCWDGRNSEGVLVPSETYFYIFDIKGIQTKGFITVLR